MEGNGTTSWRLQELERDVDELKKAKAELKDLNVLVEEVRSLRKALLTFALSTAASAIVFAFGIFEVVRP